MEIVGAKFCLDGEGLFDQVRNAIERLVPGLMYCFPTADINCIYSKYGKEAVDIPLPGGGRNQPEDELTLFMIDERHWDDFRKIRNVNYSMDHAPDAKPARYHPTTIPQIHPYCIKKVFDIDSEFYWIWDKGIKESLYFDYIVDSVRAGDTFTMVEQDPGHAVCVHAFDKDSGCLVKKDPWGARFPDGSGFNKPITREMFERNIAKYVIHF